MGANNTKSIKLIKMYNNECRHIFKSGKNKGKQCKQDTKNNYYFCPMHKKYYANRGE